MSLPEPVSFSGKKQTLTIRDGVCEQILGTWKGLRHVCFDLILSLKRQRMEDLLWGGQIWEGSMEEGGLTWAQKVDKFEKEERRGKAFRGNGNGKIQCSWGLSRCLSASGLAAWGILHSWGAHSRGEVSQGKFSLVLATAPWGTDGVSGAVGQEMMESRQLTEAPNKHRLSFFICKMELLMPTSKLS